MVIKTILVTMGIMAGLLGSAQTTTVNAPNLENAMLMQTVTGSAGMGTGQ